MKDGKTWNERCVWPRCDCPGLLRCKERSAADEYTSSNPRADVNFDESETAERTIHLPFAVGTATAAQTATAATPVVLGATAAERPAGMSKRVWKKLRKDGKVTVLEGTKHSHAHTGHTWPHGFSQCEHPALKVVTRIGETDITIGAMRDLLSAWSYNLIVKCAYEGKLDDPAQGLILPDKYTALRGEVRALPDVIQIPWPDGGLPPVKPEFWGTLLKLLPAGKVAFVCVGGHGRSGTALAAMMVEAFGMSGEEAIAYVRKNHCSDAIETRSQEMYLSYFGDWKKKQQGNIV